MAGSSWVRSRACRPKNHSRCRSHHETNFRDPLDRRYCFCSPQKGQSSSFAVSHPIASTNGRERACQDNNSPKTRKHTSVESSCLVRGLFLGQSRVFRWTNIDPNLASVLLAIDKSYRTIDRKSWTTSAWPPNFRHEQLSSTFCWRYECQVYSEPKSLSTPRPSEGLSGRARPLLC